MGEAQECSFSKVAWEQKREVPLNLTSQLEDDLRDVQELLRRSQDVAEEERFPTLVLDSWRWNLCLREYMPKNEGGRMFWNLKRGVCFRGSVKWLIV